MVDLYKIFKNTPAEFAPFLLMVLTYKCCDTPLPELLGILGKEKTFDFLLKFGGTRISFPPWSEIESSIKDAYLLWKMHSIVECDRTKVQKELCELYGTHSFKDVNARFRALNKTIYKNGSR